MKSSIQPKPLIIFSLILLAAFSRLIPHPPNFTPIGGMALFGAVYFANKYIGILIPVLALWLTDLLLNNTLYASLYASSGETGFIWFTDGFIWIAGSFFLIGVLGNRFLSKVTIGKLVGASLGASAVFFILTNFGVWTHSMVMYPANIAGLISCYIAGLPYFLNTIAGDLLYTFSLFGVYMIIHSKNTLLQPAKNVIH